MTSSRSRSIAIGWGLLSRSERVAAVLLGVAIFAAVAWIVAQFFHPAPPRRITLASGPADGMYHVHAQRYRAILERHGISVVERQTAGASENLALLLDARSGVDVAFFQGGVAPASSPSVEMLVALFYEPLWIFHRVDTPVAQINHLHGKRIAIGAPGSGTRPFVEPLLRANGIADMPTRLVELGTREGLAALKKGDVDAVFAVGSPGAPALREGLMDRELRLLNLVRADAYQRGFPHVNAMRLPAGTIDLANDIPGQDTLLIGTQAMLVARRDFHPAIVDLLVDAAREIHSGQGYFESAGEFPRVVPVDVAVSSEAARYFKQGPGLLHRYLPFWVATLVERLLVLVLPILVVLTPLVTRLPKIVMWRLRARVYRWYSALRALEHEIHTAEPPLPIDQWFAELDQIEHSVARERTLASHAREAYALRGHVRLVREAIQARRQRNKAITDAEALLRS